VVARIGRREALHEEATRRVAREHARAVSVLSEEHRVRVVDVREPTAQRIEQVAFGDAQTDAEVDEAEVGHEVASVVSAVLAEDLDRDPPFRPFELLAGKRDVQVVERGVFLGMVNRVHPLVHARLLPAHEQG